MGEKVVLLDVEIPVEQEEQLLLHEVHFRHGKAKVLVFSNGRVPGPMLILWRRVVQVLGGENERGQEDSVDGAAHALGDWRQAFLQTGQVDQRRHQRGYLDVGPLHERSDEGLEGGERLVLGGRAPIVLRWCPRGSGRKMGLGRDGFAFDDCLRLLRQIRDHVSRDGQVNELVQGGLVVFYRHERHVDGTSTRTRVMVY